MMLATKAHDNELTTSTDEEPTARKGNARALTYHLTSSNKRKKDCNAGEEPLPSGSDATCGLRVCCSSGSDRDVSAFLNQELVSTMARSAVTLSLSNGTIDLYTCSGVPVQRNKSYMRVLTSANFALTLEEKRKAGGGVMIQVRDVFNKISHGWLEQYDLDHGTAFVKVSPSLDVCVVHLRNGMETLPYNNLLAIQLTDSTPSMPVRGVLTKDSSACGDGKLFHEFSKPGDGMPLFDSDGNFVGMNVSSEKCSYVEPRVIIEQLEQFEKRNKLRAQMRLEQSRKLRVAINPREIRRRDGKHYNTNPDAIELACQDLSEEGLNCLAYPKHPETDVDGSLVLVNTFEEIFGDSYDSGKGVWNILSQKVAEGLSQSVVSLASFTGKMRFFACSGIIIKWSGCTMILTSASLVRNPLDEKKILENLTIEVLLPNKLHTEGRLEHYSLHYNVALVSFKGCGDLATANIHDPGAVHSPQVVAVGRCFESSVLMATSGTLTGWQSRFDCSCVLYSTCEVTKAGIGGPVVDLEGKFVGMNFYDWKEGTPFLPRIMIAQVLAHFEKKGIIDEVDKHGNTNRWPVPKPLWCHPEHRRRQNEEKEEYVVTVPGSSCALRYGHFNGDLVCLGRYNRRRSRPAPMPSSSV